MNNGSLDLIAEKDYDFNKIFDQDKNSMLAMIVGDLSYAEGYIQGLEYMCKFYKERYEERNKQ